MLSTLPNGHLVDAYNRFDGNIADSSKIAQEIEYAFGRSIDTRSNPKEITLLTKTVKESGAVVQGLPKDGDVVNGDLYYYDDGGRIYKRTAAGAHSLMRTVSNSHGNGMKYYGEDDYLYYTSDSLIGRYGQIINGTPTFTDDFLGAEGGVPQNTFALDLESGSTQYASKTDTTTLSITGDIAMEAWIKPESLPAVGSTMVIGSKWNVSGNQRSYKFEILAVSGFFGDSSTGNLTISADTTEAPIDSACTGTISTPTLSATNASFVAGQIVLIHQTQGSGAGTAQRNTILSYTAGTITLVNNLNATYAAGAQVRVMPQYASVTINSGKTYTAKAWNGTTGGILAFLASGTVSIGGAINATGVGFRGAAQVSGANVGGLQGEGTAGVAGTTSTSANGNAGGGGGIGSGLDGGAGGGGGGNATTGTSGNPGQQATGGTTGAASGTTDLTTMTFGGAGGSGSTGRNHTNIGYAGGNGGGIIYITGATITVTGSISASGTAGTNDTTSAGGGGGGGAGGSILLKAQTATLGTTIINASAGTGGTCLTDNAGNRQGGDGSVGRIHLDYLTSFTGSTAPTIDALQDGTLVTTATYQLRLGLSSNGTNEEFLVKNSTLSTGQYFHVAVSWAAASSTAEFFQDGVSLGTAVGALTAIFDSTAAFAVGVDFNSTPRNAYDGEMDEFRLWSIQRDADDISSNKDQYISVSTTGLVAWYKFNNDYTDATGNANNLTATNSPVFTVDVPFSAATIRNDLDQGFDTTGNVYTTPLTISEAAGDRQSFVPAKDPQKSIEVLVAGRGTGNVTITVHDPQNRQVAQVTVTHANLHTGNMEFIFANVWRPIRGVTYHFHITSTVADTTVTTTTADSLASADFHTYYQFLVDDSDYHAMEQIESILAITNGRYLATYDAAGGYDPHRLVFPAGWRARCLTVSKGLIAIGCTRDGDITQTDQGMVFFWDGIAKTYTDYLPVTEGGINAMQAYKGQLYMVAGYHAEMVVYAGGDSTNDDLKKHIPKLQNGEHIEIMPKGMTVWNGLLRIAAAGASNAATVERGVYTYGKKLAGSPASLSYDYPISTGNRASANVQIGFILPVATKLMIGWRDNVSFGMDVVDTAAAPFASGTIEMPIKDYGRVSQEKQALNVRVDLSPLRVGESVQVKYRLDRASDWVISDLVNTVGKVRARLPIVHNTTGNRDSQFGEVEIACDLFTTGNTSPRILEFGVEFDPKKTQAKY